MKAEHINDLIPAKITQELMIAGKHIRFSFASNLQEICTHSLNGKDHPILDIPKFGVHTIFDVGANNEALIVSESDT